MKECPACHRCFPEQVNHCPQDGDLLKFLIQGDTTLDGRYLLEQKLGQGGMGMVFKARHVFLKTQHAVKIILPDLVGNDPSLTTRFRQEAMAAAAIRHQNTVHVTDYGVVNGTTPFLVMEYIEGRSLHEVLVQQGRLPGRVAVEIMLAVCAGVSAAHRRDIFHRDLKPLNILLKQGEPPSEGVKVLDFGLAKIKSGELLGSFVAAQTQGMMGSPYYMAPEQWGDDDVDARSDIYSLGVILYQMLAGEVPFRGNSVPAIMKKHLSDAPQPLGERGVEVPEPLARAVSRSLEKEPALRYQTVEELSADLRAALEELGGGLAQEVGARTVPPSRAETVGLESGQGAAAATGDQRAEAARLGTNLVGRDGRTTPLEALSEQQPGSVTVADPSALSDGTPAGPAAEPPHTRGISDTARQHAAERTSAFQAGAAEHAGVADGAATQHFAGEALTEPLTSRAAEEEGRRRAEAVAVAEQEARARVLAEQEERARREAQARAQADEEETRINAAAATRARTTSAPPVNTPATPAAPTAPAAPARSRTMLYMMGGLAAVAMMVGMAAVVLYMRADDGTDANTNVNASAAGNTNAGAAGGTNAGSPANVNAGGGAVEKTRPDLVALPGGRFDMGVAEVPPLTDELRSTRPAYLLWVYAQWPAHSVPAGPFRIDRTEVTNAEYAEFVGETGHAPPPDIWDGPRPKQGEERLPVANVTFEDARAFAAWRSRRDGVEYRLPTEVEWEYAARGGDSSRLYPWGATWAEGGANVGSAGARAVGSFPRGRTPQGVEDMIGNVWEWTSTEAAMYPRNDRTTLQPADRGKLVVRGGSYKSRPDGDEPISATARRWYARDFRDPVLGFRLVRAEP